MTALLLLQTLPVCAFAAEDTAADTEEISENAAQYTASAVKT